MIIGISGKIGSGKDTVGKIIQYLTSKKDNKLKIETYLESQNTFINDGFEIKRFADKLKDMVCILIGCTREQLEDREFKEKELGEEWWYYTNSLFFNKDTKLVPYTSASKKIQDNTSWYIIKHTPRHLLQLLGTDCGRQIIHPNIWVNALFSEYTHKKIGEYNDQGGSILELPNWIITDVRFPNEAKAIKDRGGILIRIERPCEECGVYNNIACNKCSHSNLHESETALNNYQDFDYTIVNDETIEDLVEKVENVMKDMQFSNKLLIT